MISFKEFLNETTEWMIEVDRDGVPYFANVERDGRISFTKATPTSYSHSSKWKSKDRAVKILSKIPNGKLIPTYGGYVYSSKSKVDPLPTIQKRT